jgi:hypothetical protein
MPRQWEQITVWERVRVSMKTAAEYRVMADKCFKWARNTYMDEARETYLQLAQFWLDVASKLDGPPGSKPSMSMSWAARFRSQVAQQG